MQVPGSESAFHVYLQILKDFWLLAAIAAALTLATGVRNLRRSYMQRTTGQVLTNLLFSSVMAGVMVVCVLCLAEWVFPSMSPRLEMGVTLFVGIFGVKAIDMKIRKWWGIPSVDLMDRDSIAELREGMTPEERERHLRQCPFKNDCLRDAGGSVRCASRDDALVNFKENKHEQATY